MEKENHFDRYIRREISPKTIVLDFEKKFEQLIRNEVTRENNSIPKLSYFVRNNIYFILAATQETLERVRQKFKDVLDKISSDNSEHFLEADRTGLPSALYISFLRFLLIIGRVVLDRQLSEAIDKKRKISMDEVIKVFKQVVQGNIEEVVLHSVNDLDICSKKENITKLENAIASAVTQDINMALISLGTVDRFSKRK